MSTPEIYHDIDPFGTEFSDGNPKEYLDAEALKIALSMWLMSKKGDYLESLEEGGILTGALFKLPTGENEENLRFKIQVAFNTYFPTTVKLLGITISPNYSQKCLEIDIRYRDLLTGEIDNLSIYPKQDFSKSKKLVSYEPITLKGENLFTFVKIQKPEMLGQKLSFNTNESSWIWGNSLKFINFDFSDPYFEQILAYANDL